MSVLFNGHFDGFNIYESTFGNPVRDGEDLIVPAIKLWILDHTLGQYGDVVTGIMRFRRVISSTREVTPYLNESGRGFKESFFVDDGPFELTSKDICESGYFISGRIVDPYGCVDDWIIKAESFEFKCEGVYDLKLTPEGCEYLNYRTIEDAIKQATTG
ncbi:MAG: hypothetical protein ACR2PX_08180 [Endozoicomonas sp.]|uniref:hypothetical protein n=1 Tax=Endozoicomonas sp. TaxID=1892382 RepID=UPI003D9AE964